MSTEPRLRAARRDDVHDGVWSRNATPRHGAPGNDANEAWMAASPALAREEWARPGLTRKPPCPVARRGIGPSVQRAVAPHADVIIKYCPQVA